MVDEGNHILKFIIKNKKAVLCIFIIVVIGYLIYKNQLNKSYVLQKESFETYLYYHKVNDTKLTNGKDLYIFVVSTKCKDDSIDINKINVQLRLKDNYKEYSAYEINEAYAQKYFENHVEQKGKKIYRYYIFEKLWGKEDFTSAKIDISKDKMVLEDNVDIFIEI